MSSIKISTHRENTTVPNIRAPAQKYGILKHHKDSTNQQLMHLDLEHINPTMTYQIVGSMCCPNIKVTEKEGSGYHSETLLLICLQSKQKVKGVLFSSKPWIVQTSFRFWAV